MGVVYLARDLRLDREVAVKALPPELSANPEALDRLTREARLLASLIIRASP
jgi:serine/threonine protein kinase